MYKILRIGSAGIMSVFKFGDSSDGYITLTDDLWAWRRWLKGIDHGVWHRHAASKSRRSIPRSKSLISTQLEPAGTKEWAKEYQ